MLAGGRSARMGRDKAFIEVDGVPLVRRAADALAQAGAADVRVTGGDPERLRALGLLHDPDPVPFAGPLAALITAIEGAAHDPVVVLACDLPRVSAAAVVATLDALGPADAAVPTDGERLQWLHGAWRRRCLSVLQEAFDAGERAIRRAVADLELRTVRGLDPTGLADADRPVDLAATLYPSSMHIPEVDVAELARRRERGVPLIDVRQPEEYAQARVPGAQLIPLDQLPDRLGELPDGDLLVICRTGNRSAKAVEFLVTQGRSATNVAGGTVGWIEAGHGVDRGAGSA